MIKDSNWLRYRTQIFAAGLFLADSLLLASVSAAAIALRYYSPFFTLTDRAPWISILPFLGATALVMFPALWINGAYRLPRRWSLNEAAPLSIRTLLLLVPITVTLLFALRVGAAARNLVITPSRFVAGFVWAGLLVGILLLRLLAGRLLRNLYEHGHAQRRVVVVGDAQASARLANRILQNPWLGERVRWHVDHLSELDPAGWQRRLSQNLQAGSIETVWLVPPREAPASEWLPPSLIAKDRARVQWRMLPEDFERFNAHALPSLSQAQRERVYQRLQHELALPLVRVAFIGSRGAPASYGGVETYVEEVGSHLVEIGAQVAVYCHTRYVSARGLHRGMELRFVPTLPSKHFETIIHTLLSTLHALLCEEEILHYQALGPSTLAWLPRLVGRKAAVTVQGLDWQRSKWGRLARAYLRLGEWTSAHFPHLTILVSQTLAQHYHQRYHKSYTVIPNGFTPPRHRPAMRIKNELGLQERSYLLFVGRLVPEKGCHSLLHAFKQVNTDMQLVLAGQANHEGQYQARLEELAGDMHNVRLIGFVQGEILQELYSNAYLVVHPSEVEGLSISLLEALSYGNCLLVSNTPENLEASNHTAFSFQLGDPHDLAHKLQWLLDHPEQVGEMRARIRSFFNQANWRHVAEATWDAYQSVLTR